MKRTTSCSAAKALNTEIRRKIRGAMKDMEKGQPRAAATKLYQAGEIIRTQTKGVWKPAEAKTVGGDATYVSGQLMKPSTMHWPKWKDRAKAMLDRADVVAARTKTRCP